MLNQWSTGKESGADEDEEVRYQHNSSGYKNITLPMIAQSSVVSKSQAQRSTAGKTLPVRANDSIPLLA